MAVSTGGFIGPRRASGTPDTPDTPDTPTDPDALVPWPATAAARTTLKAGINAPNLSDDRADALGSTAGEIVQRYASAAPVVVKNEAAIRLAGWLRVSAKGDIIPTGVGGITFSWRPTVGRNALRQCGSMGILSQWHRPRAMILEESD